MKKRIVMAALAATMLIGMNASQAFASDDSIPYSFKIKANYANTYSDKEYRQTTNTQNKWKVDMTYSEEGEGTITTYDVTQGTGTHYYSAYSSASQRDVCLGAENNNNSSNTYTVGGYWDEETD